MRCGAVRFEIVRYGDVHIVRVQRYGLARIEYFGIVRCSAVRCRFLVLIMLHCGTVLLTAKSHGAVQENHTKPRLAVGITAPLQVMVYPNCVIPTIKYHSSNQTINSLVCSNVTIYWIRANYDMPASPSQKLTMTLPACSNNINFDSVRTVVLTSSSPHNINTTTPDLLNPCDLLKSYLTVDLPPPHAMEINLPVPLLLLLVARRSLRART